MTAVRIRVPLLAALSAALVLAGCGDDDANPPAASGVSSPPTASGAASATTAPAAGTSTVTCDYASDGQQPARPVSKPSAQAPNRGTVTATITTNRGVLRLTLDQAKAPCTVNSFRHLAQEKFFDNTPCPRLVASPGGFEVLQCGDPSGTGTGGPGYGVPDENPTDLKPYPGADGAVVYPAGTVAMANSGRPNSGGSQFFLVYGDTALAPDYAVFGTVDAAGVQVLKAIGARGDDGTHPAGGGQPLIGPVTITSVTVAN